MVQWLELGTFTAMGQGSIPGQRTKISQVAQCNQKKKKKAAAFISPWLELYLALENEPGKIMLKPLIFLSLHSCYHGSLHSLTICGTFY